MNKMTKHQSIQSVREELVSYIKENIKDYIDTKVSELRYNLFSKDGYIVGIYESKQWLRIHGLDGLEVLNDVKRFEIDMYGEISETRIKELTSYETLVNAYWYWVGNLVLEESDCLFDNRNKFLTEEIADKIIGEL